MNVGDYLASLVRTYVPAGVGLLLAYLATRWGIVLDEETSAGLTLGAAGLAAVLYYAAVRVAEARWPWVGALLGWQLQPRYTPAVLDLDSEQVGRLLRERQAELDELGAAVDGSGDTSEGEPGPTYR